MSAPRSTRRRLRRNDPYASSGLHPAQRAKRALDLKALESLLRAEWKLFATLVGLVTALALLAAFLVTPKYTANLTFYFDPNKRLDSQFGLAGTPPESSFVDTEIGRYLARPVLEAVVDRLHLAADPEFAGKGATPTTAANGGGNVDAARRRENAIKHLHSNMAIQREGTSYIATLSAKSTSAEKARDIANAFPAAFLQVRREQQTVALADLRSQVQSLAADVLSADAAVANYRSSKGLVPSRSAAQNVTDQQIASLTDGVASAESDLAGAQSRLQAATAQRRSTGAQDIGEAARSPVIAEYRRQRAQLASEQARITDRYGPLHPESTRVQKQLADIDSKIREESNRSEIGLRGDVVAARSRAESLRAELNRLRAQQSTNTKASVEADRLERDADARRAVYAPMAQAEQRIAQQLTLVVASVISPASTPITPSFPNKPMLLVLGAIMGFCLAGAVVMIKDSRDQSIRSPEDVEDAFGLPLLSSIPSVTQESVKSGVAARVWDMPLYRPRSAYCEALRALRAKLVADKTGTQGEVICITSALPREGKSTLAVSLARIMAISGDKVMLIDGDLRHRTLRLLQHDTPVAGIVEVLQREGSLQQAIVRDSASPLHILPQTDKESTVRDVFGGSRMRTLIRVLKSNYRFIVIDCPPVLALADAVTLARVADTTVLAVNWGSTPAMASQAALHQLRENNAHVSGIVLTQVDISTRSKIGAQSPYYYYDEFKDYYTN